ncbi:protein-glutamine gamma-glutamyltransferase [Bacillus sp. AFS002410]|uniref:protein-glutamine gamma-glutamyltransferase n=1 Tax=Bacillus sp. AFS002410 TaxID=2033481 RepID=UPI000BF0111F|nr:protein-glutamine gamma-glutamyltransferase [Bacillus sp. AFS002410]PEJ60288.1 protein-glutamine gamma-glutamyltransferase [Bacillus sp. AFS002410]
MDHFSGTSIQQTDTGPSDSVVKMLIQRINEDQTEHEYRSINEFESILRNNIILSARAMYQSRINFAVFAKSRCNPMYWQLMGTGGFLLRQGVKPSDAIKDIFINSPYYAFECATAMVIIFYNAVLNLIGENLFNQIFQNIYLYGWHADPDLGISAQYAPIIPGDVVYFNNPDFSFLTPEWRGENAVVLGDGTFFGHGLGIMPAEQIIFNLNRMRRPGAFRSAYLTNSVTRPNINQLAKLSNWQRDSSFNKQKSIVIHHNESSISFDYYKYLLSLFTNI